MQKYEVEGHEPSFLPDGKKWKPVWSDEFDGDRLDTDKWSFRLNYWGYPAEQYTDKGVSLDGNGCVVFRPVVENGMVKSSQLQTGANSFDNLDLYGKISSRIGETSSFDFRLGEKELHISLKNVDDPDLREEISSIIVISDITAEKAVARQKSDFFQNASHELKTPVTVIRGLTEIMLQKHPEDDFIRQKLITVHNESVRLASIIADMLKLSGLETADESGEDDEPPLTELADVARELADELSERIEEKHLSVTISGGGSVYIHKKDAFELIENLLSNALNYNKEGGKVDVCVKRDGGKVILSVSDTGIGIEQQHIPRLCERFYRVDKSRSKKTGGTGLGLAIVKHICIRYNASLDIESVFGKGTCVTVGFPAPDGV